MLGLLRARCQSGDLNQVEVPAGTYSPLFRTCAGGQQLKHNQVHFILLPAARLGITCWDLQHLKPNALAVEKRPCTAVACYKKEVAPWYAGSEGILGGPSHLDAACCMLLVVPSHAACTLLNLYASEQTGSAFPSESSSSLGWLLVSSLDYAKVVQASKQGKQGAKALETVQLDSFMWQRSSPTGMMQGWARGWTRCERKMASASYLLVCRGCARRCRLTPLLQNPVQTHPFMNLNDDAARAF